MEWDRAVLEEDYRDFSKKRPLNRDQLDEKEWPTWRSGERILGRKPSVSLGTLRQEGIGIVEGQIEGECVEL